MNKEMMQVALHRDRRLVPINVTVYKLRGSGEDMLFMAIMEVGPPANLGLPAWREKAFRLPVCAR